MRVVYLNSVCDTLCRVGVVIPKAYKIGRSQLQFERHMSSNSLIVTTPRFNAFELGNNKC